MTRLFDTVVIVDWSASASPSPSKPSPDAVWIAAEGAAPFPPRYFRTRADALAFLSSHLAAERAAGRRTLAGFDFPFGYPRGFAAALTGRAEARAVWAHLAARVTDGPANANNRFASAAERDLFRSDPGRYEPAYGGWCAYGASVGIRWDVDPEAFEIYDGRLFVFSRNEEADARELWDREDRSALIARADRYWETAISE